MKFNKSITLLLFIIVTVISCPQNCLSCEQDEIECIICKPGFKLDEKINVCTLDTSHFSYDHQQKWDGVCGGGNRQSPIDIVIRNVNLCPKINITETSINPEGQSLKASFVNFSKIIFYDSGDVRSFQSAQFHWHSPSEHTINGKAFDLELHMVHPEIDVSGQYSVIGLLFKVNEELKNDVADNYNFVDNKQNGGFQFPWNIRNKMFYHYKGSLTTPPCTETVEWFVITEYYEISRQIFLKIKTAINEGHSNAREVQPLNGRRPMMIGKFCNILQRTSN